ncbi:MAG: hypothetical protein H7235_11535 [Bdellovibrionaceae bacterium]|nr:hypothetical protein [Pseudobdellovibrionaceae bacterium]
MDRFLYWYSQNNKIIIQFLCICIGLVIIYFIYRIFFNLGETASDGDDGRTQLANKQLADLDKKISKMMDHQVSTSKPAVFTGEASEYEANAKADALAESAAASAAAGAIAGEVAAESQNEVAQLKKELQSSVEIIAAKNTELNTVKEKLIEHQKAMPNLNIQSTMDNLTSSSQVVITGTGENDKTLVAKIDELERKLNEYDIISDDIAELQSLRAENAELKSKASAG